MALITLRAVSLSYGGQPLLERVNLQLERGERVCLVGLNGTGKSTLMKVVRGNVAPDEGEVLRQPGLRIGDLPQEVPGELAGPVLDVVAGGLGELGNLLSEFHHLSQRLAGDGEGALLARLESVQHEVEAAGGWQIEQRVEAVLSRLQLDGDARFETLSGGLKRRVLLARALVSEPDLLLLDEPTNHLDIGSIAWLEEFLLSFGGTLLFVTHDRTFLQRLATRIIELDRGQLTDWPGDYGTYLARKQALLEAEARQQALFDKKLAQEEAWIRQGIKARRTRNEGRVRALQRLREERRARRGRAGTVSMALEAAERSGKQVIEARGVSFGYGDRPVIRDLTTLILRGDKIGIIGPNGSGKTTLLRLLLGQVAPQQGELRHGTALEVAYFDQLRAQLDEDATVRDNVAQGSDQVIINGKTRHVMSYLQDFLFSPERTRTPVKALSGGERNRLLLARLFTRPANLLVMDEPTNDLDIETLELLEELLLDYPGTLLLVSHDRTFLNNVVTSTLVLEGDGRVREYVGGYDDWLRQRADEPPSPPEKSPAPAAKTPVARDRPRKLSYKEQRELESLPHQIEALEQEQARLHATLADPAFYRQGGAQIAAIQAQLATVDRELAHLYRRWEALETLAED